MPPLACKVTLNAEPTELSNADAEVVTDGLAGIVMVAEPLLVGSATEVAVTVAVCAELVAAGAV